MSALGVVEARKSYKKLDSKDIIDAYESVFLDYGWNWNTLMHTSIPMFFELLKSRTRRLKREKKAMGGNK